MAKLISILFSILILFQSFNLQLEDYSKISVLFEHAQFHDDNYGDSIIDFVVEHYNTSYFDSDKQHKEHKNLPFKKERSSKNQVNSFTLNLDSYTFNNITFRKISLNFFYNVSYSTLVKPNVFQPPQQV
jgi:hypothetical protein